MLDSHCHLDDSSIYEDRERIVKEAKEAGVSLMITIGCDLESSKRAIEIAHEFEGVYAAIGFHPQNLENVSDDALEEIRKMASDKKVVAIGEIGLDYHWFKEKSEHDNQKVWFNKQIDLANELHLPISIHARDATEDTYEMLVNNPPKYGAVLHCYSGSTEMMDKFDKLGLYYGFDGPITYKNSVTPKENVKRCPIDKILTETDSPYLTPTPFRGTLNGPKHIKEILQEMANLRGVSINEMEIAVENNFKRLFETNED
ncbi:MAG: TatD family hydrolase [Bacilli bacterium]|nr:TatD family hydrolase [Bacilli bacterium]